MEAQHRALLVTPSQQALESPAGYVLRLAESNGYFTPRSIAALAKHPPRDVFTSRMDMRRFAPLLGSAPARLHGYIADDGTSVVLCGQRINHQELSLGIARVCPECIAERGYRPAWTDLSIIDACPFHRRPFVVSCSACKRALKWERPGLVACKCGGNLEECGARADACVAEDHTALLQAVIREFEGTLNAINASTFKANENGLSFLDWLALVRAAAGIHRRLYPDGDDVSVARRAAAVLIDCQQQLSAAMRRLAPGEVRLTGMNLLAKHQRWLTQSWGKALGSSSLAYLRRRLEFLPEPENADAQPRSMELTAWPEPKSEKRFKVQRVASPRSVAPPGSRTYFNRDAAREAGIPLAALKYLRTQGLFKVNNRANRGDGYHEKDVQAFKDELMARAVPAPELETLCGFQHAVRWMNTGSADGKGRFIRAILEKSIPLYEGPDGSFESLKVSLADARHFASEVQAERHSGAYSVTVTARMLGCSPESVSGLLELQLLTAVQTSLGPRPTAESIRRFEGEYRFLAPFASEVGTSTPTLLKLSEMFSIPVQNVARKASKRHQPFIRLIDLPALAVALDEHRESRFSPCTAEAVAWKELPSSKFAPVLTLTTPKEVGSPIRYQLEGGHDSAELAE